MCVRGRGQGTGWGTRERRAEGQELETGYEAFCT